MNRNLKQLNQKPRTELQAKKVIPWALRFSPTAWAKLLYFRDKTENEIGGFGITPADDLLYVREFVTIQQEVTCASVRFDDEAVANLFEDQVDLGRSPQQFARIWVHCHPGDCPRPSMIDEETFARVFGGCDFAIMCIVACGDQSYARIRFNVGPGGQMLIPVQVDYAGPFEGSNHTQWDQEFKTNVHEAVFQQTIKESQPGIFGDNILPYDVMEELDQMDEHERQMVLDELAQNLEYYGREEVELV